MIELLAGIIVWFFIILFIVGLVGELVLGSSEEQEKDLSKKSEKEPMLYQRFPF